jgi:ATPase subunit of ABC transporter with duplicated ATPase domains
MTAAPFHENRPCLEAVGLSLDTPGGRPLVKNLDLALGRERVALVGRNGSGKSTLLAALAGQRAPTRGDVVCHTRRLLVPQLLDGGGQSPGEHRRRRLDEARRRAPGLLLLDEPTADLDVQGVDWLCDWLPKWQGGLLVVSHHRQLLELFDHFFVVAESGCRYFHGSFAALERDLEARRDGEEVKYLRKLNVLAASERHDDAVRRRRRRKKNLGRLHEERRAPCRAQLMGKKGYAQKSQARAARIREARIEAVREETRAARRALEVRLPLELAVPPLAADDGRPIATLEGVALERGGRTLVRDLDLRLARDRLGVVGPNGAGKSTLLALLRGEHAPAQGSVRLLTSRIAGIAQGAADWRIDESLLEHLGRTVDAQALAGVIAAHRFPLALAGRPLRSLSAGERLRAALMCLFQRAPDLLVLDEPTASLDLVGSAALVAALRAWRGGLVVASHDRAFLRDIGITRCLELDGEGRVTGP